MSHHQPSSPPELAHRRLDALQRRRASCDARAESLRRVFDEIEDLEAAIDRAFVRWRTDADRLAVARLELDCAAEALQSRRIDLEDECVVLRERRARSEAAFGRLMEDRDAVEHELWATERDVARMQPLPWYASPSPAGGRPLGTAVEMPGDHEAPERPSLWARMYRVVGAVLTLAGPRRWERRLAELDAVT